MEKNTQKSSFVLTISKNTECVQSSIDLDRDRMIKVLSKLLYVQPIDDKTIIHVCVK